MNYESLGICSHRKFLTLKPPKLVLLVASETTYTRLSLAGKIKLVKWESASIADIRKI